MGVNGGKRPGAGRKKGSHLKRTLDKLAAREAAREIITASLRPMLQAHIAHAVGIWHLYTRDKKGKYSRIEDEAHIERLLTEGQEQKDYWIFAKDPSTQSFTELLNRALDKSKEQPQDINLTGTMNLVGRLHGARQRIRNR